MPYVGSIVHDGRLRRNKFTPFTGTVVLFSTRVARAKIRCLGDASVHTTRYRGGVVQGHEPDERGSFAVGEVLPGERCLPADHHTPRVCAQGHGEPPEAMRIRLLGDFEVSVGTRTIEDASWRLRKAASLVKLLALAPGHRLHRERAMDLLWPDLGHEGGLQQPARDPPRRPQGAGSGGRLPLPGLRGRGAPAVSGRRPLGRRGGVRGGRARRPPLPEPGGLTGRPSTCTPASCLPGDRYEEWTEGRREELRQTVPRAAHRARRALRGTGRARAGHRGARARRWPKSQPTKKRTQPSCAFTPSPAGPNEPSPSTNGSARPSSENSDAARPRRPAACATR